MRRRVKTRAEERAEGLWMLFQGCTISCWFPFYLGYRAFQKVQNIPKIAKYLRKRDAKRAAKPPKPMRRKRALSICSYNNSSRTTKSHSTAQQTQYGFFKLPVELRIAIYEEVIGGNHIYIILRHGRLCSNKIMDAKTRAKLDRSYSRIYCNPQLITGSPYLESGLRIMGALQSCRSVYTEMISLVYSVPQFHFSDPSSLFAFVGTILPQRFNSIRSIHIDQLHVDRTWTPLSFNSPLDYESIRHLNIIASPFPRSIRKPEDIHLLRIVCQILCEMKALKELRIDFLYETLQRVGETGHVKSATNDVNFVLAMLESREFKVLDISFDRVPPEAERWIDLPFVRLRS